MLLVYLLDVQLLDWRHDTLGILASQYRIDVFACDLRRKIVLVVAGALAHTRA